MDPLESTPPSVLVLLAPAAPPLTALPSPCASNAPPACLPHAYRYVLTKLGALALASERDEPQDAELLRRMEVLDFIQPQDLEVHVVARRVAGTVSSTKWGVPARMHAVRLQPLRAALPTLLLLRVLGVVGRVAMPPGDAQPARERGAARRDGGAAPHGRLQGAGGQDCLRR